MVLPYWYSDLHVKGLQTHSSFRTWCGISRRNHLLSSRTWCGISLRKHRHLGTKSSNSHLQTFVSRPADQCQQLSTQPNWNIKSPISSEHLRMFAYQLRINQAHKLPANASRPNPSQQTTITQWHTWLWRGRRRCKTVTYYQQLRKEIRKKFFILHFLFTFS